MKVTVIGSTQCPDTLYALHELKAAGAEIEYKDILSCHAVLLDYLALRDGDPLYDGIRGTRRIGIPCFVLEDGTRTLELRDVIK